MAISTGRFHGRGIDVTIPVLLLILCGDTRLAARENHPDQILRNRVESSAKGK